MTIARICGAAALVLALPAHPQVVLDGTLGPSGALSGPNYSIPHTFGQQVGGNLFHSFRSFNLTSTQSATFTGLAGTSNVISRVTGGTASSINGQVNSSIAGANFYFINPSGIVFGPSARINVPGAFHASTAGYLRLGSGGKFDAINPGGSTLTVDAPSAFGFYAAPAPIVLSQADLKHAPGQTISLVGGRLSINGRLWAPSGRINLASVGSAGEVTLGSSGIGSSASSYGDIVLSGGLVLTDPNPGTGGAAGPIFIRGGQLSMTGSAISARNEGPGPGANVDITLAGDLSMSGSLIRSSALGGGDAGNTTIRATNVSLAGGSVIETSSVDLNNALGGQAGSTTIEATGDVLLADGAQIASISFFGNAGQMTIRARSLTLRDGGRLNASTFGDGSGGTVVVDVDGSFSMLSGGNVLAASLFDSRVAPGSGTGGDIVVNAGTVDISGPGSGLFSVTHTFGAGGRINVNAGRVSVANGGRITSASEDPHFFGTVGNAGSIDVVAAERITLLSDGAITTSSVSAGGGIINLSAGQVLELTNSRITTSVADGTGNGGDINIDPVFVVLNNSQIIAQAFGGNGGDITIVTQFLIMSPDSIIDASSRFGLSGRVVITAPSVDVGSRLAVLSTAYVDPASRLRDSCATRAGAGNSFVGVGRGGLPASPQSAAFAAYGAFAPLAAAALPADKSLVCRS